MLAACPTATWMSQDALRATHLDCSYMARQLLHVMAKRRLVEKRCLPRAPWQLFASARRSVSTAAASRVRPTAGLLNTKPMGPTEPASDASDRPVVSAGVLPSDGAMPGELLVHATQTTVATSTLVLGCLFSMLGAKPQASGRKGSRTEPSDAVCALLAQSPDSPRGSQTGDQRRRSSTPESSQQRSAALVAASGGGIIFGSGGSGNGAGDGRDGMSGGGDSGIGAHGGGAGRWSSGGNGRDWASGGTGGGSGRLDGSGGGGGPGTGSGSGSGGGGGGGSWAGSSGGRAGGFRTFGAGGSGGGSDGSGGGGGSIPHGDGDSDGGGVMWLLALAAVLACWSPMSSVVRRIHQAYGSGSVGKHDDEALQPQLDAHPLAPLFNLQFRTTQSAGVQPAPLPVEQPAGGDWPHGGVPVPTLLNATPVPSSPPALLAGAGVLLGVAAGSVARMSRLGSVSGAPVAAAASGFCLRLSLPGSGSGSGSTSASAGTNWSSWIGRVGSVQSNAAAAPSGHPTAGAGSGPFRQHESASYVFGASGSYQGGGRVPRRPSYGVQPPEAGQQQQQQERDTVLPSQHLLWRGGSVTSGGVGHVSEGLPAGSGLAGCAASAAFHADPGSVAGDLHSMGPGRAAASDIDARFRGVGVEAWFYNAAAPGIRTARGRASVDGGSSSTVATFSSSTTTTIAPITCRTGRNDNIVPQAGLTVLPSSAAASSWEADAAGGYRPAMQRSSREVVVNRPSDNQSTQAPVSDRRAASPLSREAVAVAPAPISGLELGLRYRVPAAAVQTNTITAGATAHDWPLPLLHHLRSDPDEPLAVALVSTPDNLADRAGLKRSARSPTTATTSTLSSCTIGSVSLDTNSPSHGRSGSISSGAAVSYVDAGLVRSELYSMNGAGGSSSSSSSIHLPYGKSPRRGDVGGGDSGAVKALTALRSSGPRRGCYIRQEGTGSGYSSRAASSGSGNAGSAGGCVLDAEEGSPGGCNGKRYSLVVTTNLREEIDALGAASSGLGGAQRRAERWLRTRPAGAPALPPA